MMVELRLLLVIEMGICAWLITILQVSLAHPIQNE